MEFGQAYCKDFLKMNQRNLFLFLKFILFILNFKNSNLNEFDLTKILKKEKKGIVHLGWPWSSFTNLILFAYFQSI
jgi:hypothetical protein